MGQGDTIPVGARASLSESSFAADDPAVRFGEALFETMRADRGEVAFLSRHLKRLLRSAHALYWSGAPDEAQLRSTLRAALDEEPRETLRIRLTVSRSGRIAVETSAIPAPPAPTAITLLGAWQPNRRIAEHKTTSYAANRLAQSRADAAGAGHALLLDSRGHIGETAFANVVCAVDGIALTPPIRGILPGIAREVAIEKGGVHERELPPETWARADEIVALNVLRGPMPIHAIDGRAIGLDTPGSLESLLHDTLADRSEAEAP